VSRGKPLVLLVEDDRDTAMLYQALLAGEGLEVVHCEDCAQVKAWWGTSDRQPDLIVLDMRLPDGDGLMLCSDIMRKRRDEAGPPVMVLSAHGDPRLPSLCRQAGARAFLDKLSGLDVLLATARDLLGAKLCPEN
jgi:DNA-binding response OmpR family regulator